MTAIAADSLRERLLGLLEARRAYEFLTAADTYLRATPDDGFVRLMAVREYLKLGLVEPAQELAHGFDGAAVGNADAEPLIHHLRGLRKSVIDWSTRSSMFEANLDAFANRGFPAGDVRGAWEISRGRFQLYQDRQGAHQIRMRADNGWQWIPFLGKHEEVDQARPLPEALKAPTPLPIIFDGVDLGGFFRRVHQASRNTFLGYSAALFIVEPRVELIALLFHLHDWQDIIADKRVLWFLGESWAGRLAQAWEKDPDLPFPGQAIRLSAFRPAASPDLVKFVNQQADLRESQIKTSLHALEARYADRDLSHWANRFTEALAGRGAPLRIVCAVSRHTTFLQYSVRDVKRAVESLGHEFVVLTETSDHGIVSPLQYHQAFRDNDADLFFVLDHLRPEFAALLPKNLPVLTWDQDYLPHVFTPVNMDGVARHDFLGGISKPAWLRAGKNPRQYLHLRVPTNPDEFAGSPLTDEEQARFGCDISYVSHASQTPAAFHAQEREQFGDARLQRLLDTIFENLPTRLAKYRVARGWLAEELLENAERACGIVVRDEALRRRIMGWYIWRLGDRLFRHEALEWAAGWARSRGRSLRIHGNGWETHPTLAAHAAGPVENGRELLCLYRASKINLQLMPAGFIHQRALDGLAGGGFFLTRLEPCDLLGRTLRRLVTRMHELGIRNQRELLANTSDAALKTMLQAYIGDWLRRASPEEEEIHQHLVVAAEWEYPDEVFPSFREIVFDSAGEFAAAADRFLADESRRRAIADEMRQVVIERFSYRRTISQLLQSMVAYLKEEASK